MGDNFATPSQNPLQGHESYTQSPDMVRPHFCKQGLRIAIRGLLDECSVTLHLIEAGNDLLYGGRA